MPGIGLVDYAAGVAGYAAGVAGYTASELSSNYDYAQYRGAEGYGQWGCGCNTGWNHFGF